MEMICCFTGPRPQNFPWDYYNSPYTEEYLADMEWIVEELIRVGYNRFISGGALGVDLDVAEAVLRAREKHKDIRLEIAVPCRNQSGKWNAEEKLRYDSVLARADEVTVLFERYTRGCMFARNRYMVDKSDFVFAFWNDQGSSGTHYTVSYTEKTKKPFEVYALEEITEEYKEEMECLIKLFDPHGIRPALKRKDNSLLGRLKQHKNSK